MNTKPEKVIVHAAYPLWRKHALIAIARAKELQDEGADVLVTYCDSRHGTCAVNFAGSPLTCSICRSRVKQSGEAAGLTLVPLQELASVADDGNNVTWNQQKDIVEGIHSAVTSTFRQLPEDTAQNRLIRAIKKRYFKTTIGLLRSLNSIIGRFQPDRIEVFNGRQACSRFCLTAARSAGIAFNTLEVTSRAKPIIFKGHTAHDRIKIQERMMTHSVNADVANGYFERRRTPSVNKYAKKHASTFTPPASDGFTKTISVFLSSQDEFESLGAQWKSVFLDYAGVLERVCRENPDYLFCIRFHPNQADMASDIKTPFLAIAKMPNTVIYYPTDTANTYALMEWSDVVVTFGSTVTVEACWMGKPTILLGPSFFDQLDVAYTPTNIDEFCEIIRQDLRAKDSDNAARVASFEELDHDEMKYLSHNGKTIKPQGIRVYKPWLSQIARTSDNVFCRAVKAYSRFSAGRRKAG